MNPLSLFSSVPLRSQPLRWSQVRFYLFTVLFAAGNLVVPLVFHSVPNAGPVFVPLFWFTLFAAWQFGLTAGLVVALVSPVLNYFLVGMPIAALLPSVLFKSVVLAAAAALLARRLKSVHFLGLVFVVVLMQASGFVWEQIAGVPLAKSTAMLVQALPGLLIMSVGGWIVLRLVNGTWGQKAQ